MSSFLWKAVGLNPITEFYFAKPRKWRFDWAIPELKIAIEQEGGIWSRGRHVRGAGYLKDMEKYNMAARQGWLVFRFTPQEVIKGVAQSFVADAIKELQGIRTLKAENTPLESKPRASI